MASQTHYFKKIIKEVGISLSSEEKSNVLTQEQSLVVRDIESKLSCGNVDNNVKSFIKGLQIFCKERSSFQKALMPTILNKPSARSDIEENMFQDSLVHLFLRVTCLQNDIIELILEEITAHADEETADNAFMGLLLNAMRYLPFIKEPHVLTQKLLDISDIATFPLQLEILKSIPEIIPDGQCDETAKQVSKLLDDINLTGAIIDCLNSLNLSADALTDIQDDILDRLVRRTSLQVFPILFEFVIIDCKGPKLGQTLLKVRDALNEVMRNESSDKEVVSAKVILCDKLYSLSSVQKVLYEGWINFYATTQEHKPIDYLLLFMLHQSSTKKKMIEMLFKKRVKTGFFKTASLDSLFEKYIVPQILYNYLPSIIEIATNLLRNANDILLQEFATSLFKLTFTNPHLDQMQRQDVVTSFVFLMGSSDSKCISVVLNILTELKSDPKLQQHTLQLMGLLTEIDRFELKDVRQLFELLCDLTGGINANDSMSGLKDELHMLIRKQLTSTTKLVKQRGIIAAVMMVKYSAVTEDDQSELDLSEESVSNISALPKGGPQESAALLELAMTCISGNPDLMGLYYDQLSAAVLSIERLDKYFMTWLYESITQDFQDLFVVESIPEPINDIALQCLYSLNTAEEVETNIYINIGELTIRPSYTKHANIMIMSALFRLLRLLHSKQHNGDLASIDALLGCGIIMPEVNDVNNYDLDQIKQIADCTFHCINWFREVISAFVTQKNKKLRLKVLERLHKLVELEEQLRKCAECVPEHKLPNSYFHNISSQSISSPTKSEVKISRPKKRFKSSETVTNLNETSTSSVAITQHQKQKQVTTKKGGTTKNIACQFREIDTDIIILLKYPLKLDDSDETNIDEQTTQQTTITIESLQFLLKDFNEKLRILTKSKNLGMSNLSIVKPIDLLTDCIKLLPFISKDFNAIINKLSQLLDSVDGLHDKEEIYTSLANNFKMTLGLIFEGLSLVFGWSGFQNLKVLKNLNMLKDCLKALGSEGQSQLHSASHLMKEFVNRLHKHVNHCLYLQCAVSLIKTMQVLYSINDSPEIRTKIASASEKLLKKKWYNLQGELDRGKQALVNIDFLVKAYLTDASIKTIGGLVATLQVEAPNLKTKEDYLLMLGCIDKTSFHILYRCICSSLLDRVKIEIASLSNNGHLVLWRTVALTMQGVQTIVKAQETRTNLIVYLKKSIGILKVFLSHGIPILEIMLRSKTDEVIEILKIMQTSTRFLHHLCCYSKLNKDLSLLAHVPQFRFTLETFVFRVKAALVANNCSQAFWLGNLKNRDLHGEDILTPSTNSDINEERNSDDELPLDDSDEEMPEENVGSVDGTASEIFD